MTLSELDRIKAYGALYEVFGDRTDLVVEYLRERVAEDREQTDHDTQSGSTTR